MNTYRLKLDEGNIQNYYGDFVVLNKNIKIKPAINSAKNRIPNSHSDFN